LRSSTSVEKFQETVVQAYVEKQHKSVEKKFQETVVQAYVEKQHVC
jgi:hypothetical protein